MRRILVVCSLLAFSCGSSVAQTGELDQSFIPPGGGSGDGLIHSQVHQGQSLLVGISGYLSTVDLQIIKRDPFGLQDDSLYSYPLLLSIHTGNPTGTMLALFDIAPEDIPWESPPGSYPPLVQVDVSSAGIELTAGNGVSLVLWTLQPKIVTDTAYAEYAVRCVMGDGSAYPGGTQWYYTPDYGWQSWPEADFSFQTYMIPIPEPTTLTLLGLGSLALVMGRRRR